MKQTHATQYIHLAGSCQGELNRLMGTLKQKSNGPQYGDCYTGRWWVGCYIWYSEEGPGRAAFHGLTIYLNAFAVGTLRSAFDPLGEQSTPADLLAVFKGAASRWGRRAGWIGKEEWQGKVREQKERKGRQRGRKRRKGEVGVPPCKNSIVRRWCYNSAFRVDSCMQHYAVDSLRTACVLDQSRIVQFIKRTINNSNNQLYLLLTVWSVLL